MSDLDYPVFDADNHYYEALDAFTRHLDPTLGPPLRAVVRDRRPQVPRGRRQGEPRGREPHVRPDRQGRRDARLLPRQPRRPATRSSSSRDREPIRARVPRPRRPHRDARRARPRGGLAVPDARHALRGAAQARPRGGHASRSRAFNRWLDEDWGFAYQDRIFAAPYLSLADLDWAVARARVGARPRRPHRRDAPGRADARPTGQLPAERPVFDPFWARVQRGRHHRRRARGRQRLLAQRLRATTASRPTFSGGGWRAVDQDRSHIERADLRLPRHARVRQALRPLPEPPHRVGRERRRVPRATCSEAALDRPQDARLLHRGPGRDVPAQRLDQPVLGGRRRRGRRAHGRRPRDLRLRLAAHRGHARARSTTRSSSRSFDDDDRSARSCATTPRAQRQLQPV